jgi:hypothetical protein
MWHVLQNKWQINLTSVTQLKVRLQTREQIIVDRMSFVPKFSSEFSSWLGATGVKSPVLTIKAS